MIWKWNTTSEQYSRYQTDWQASISAVDITSNGENMVVATAEQLIIIRRKGITRYNYKQQLTTDNPDYFRRKVYLHDDMEYLVIPDRNEEKEFLMKIYKINSTTDMFYLFDTKNFGAKTYVDHSIS